MRRRQRLALLLALVAAIAAGCDRNADGRDALAPDPNRGPVETGTGAVRGAVIFRGIAPEPELIPGSSCHKGSPEIEVHSIRADASGRLMDVAVFLKDAPPAPPLASQSPQAVLLDQVNCEYVPHVVAMQIEQPLEIRSSDDTLHNVHALSLRNPPFNFGMPGAGGSRAFSFTAPESFKIKCDVHPWMSAWVHVFDHPYFAVTGEDGTYEIRNLPPGERTLVFRHEFLGDVEVTVNVANDETVEADAVYQRSAK